MKRLTMIFLIFVFCFQWKPIEAQEEKNIEGYLTSYLWDCWHIDKCDNEIGKKYRTFQFRIMFDGEKRLYSKYGLYHIGWWNINENDNIVIDFIDQLQAILINTGYQECYQSEWGEIAGCIYSIKVFITRSNQLE